jgi:UDP-N-acetyl-D-glucosamine dehydrogenase
MVQAVTDLRQMITAKTARVVVIGLGHAGFPEAISFARAGFPVIGYDKDENKVRSINAGSSHLVDVDSGHLRQLLDMGRFRAERSPSVLSEADVVLIAVPTLLTKHKNPDVKAVTQVAEELAGFISRPTLVVLESTVYPGTTEEVIKTAFDRAGLKPDVDYFLACSPSRIDPGNKKWPLTRIPRIVGGLTPRSLDAALGLYCQVMDSVVPASSLMAAEMAKLLENSFRAVNIAFIDQMHMICHQMGLDVWEIIDMASTKPFGFMPFYPGAGPGGECIPVDPFYISWKAREHGFRSQFIDLAGEIMDLIPGFIVHCLYDYLNAQNKALNGAKILLLGAAYKPDVADTNRAPIYQLLPLLERRQARVDYHDPHVAGLRVDGTLRRSIDLNAQEVGSQDAIIILTGHSSVDYELIARHSPLVMDTCNAMAGLKGNIYR